MKAKPNTQTIFVVESGWVFMADDYKETPDNYILHNASTIRVWGTTAGLGQLALNGPTKDTVLDPCGAPTIPKGKVLFVLPCTF